MRLLVCLVAALCAPAAFSQGGPPGGGGPPPLSNHPGVYLEQRDFQGNRTTTERTIFPNPHPAIEYSFTTNQVTNVTHVAYTKGSTITAQVRFKNDTDFPFSGNLNLISARLACPGLQSGTEYLPLTISSSQTSLTLPPGGGASVTVTIGGAPNYIAVGGLEVKYSLILMKNPGPDQEGPYENGTGQSGWENWVRVCLLDSTPIGLQAVPWTDFLEYTCRWAFGASGTTQVLSEMTKGIHYSGRVSPNNTLRYSGAVGRFWLLEPTSTTGGSYDLTKYLNIINGSNPYQKTGNCADFAGLLHLAVLSHGIQTDCLSMRAESTEFFTTWPLCPAGSDPSITFPRSYSLAGNYNAASFRFHVVVIRSEDSVYDASNAYYFGLTGNNWYKPALAWSSTDFWQKSTNPHWGLTFSTGPSFVFSDLPEDLPLGKKSAFVPKIVTSGLKPMVIQ